MSHRPVAIATVDHTALMARGMRASAPQLFIEIASTTMAPDHVPLSNRASEDLLARAEELRRMAATATTEDVMKALLVLADRYVALAEKRRGRGG